MKSVDQKNIKIKEILKIINIKKNINKNFLIKGISSLEFAKKKLFNYF